MLGLIFFDFALRVLNLNRKLEQGFTWVCCVFTYWLTKNLRVFGELGVSTVSVKCSQELRQIRPKPVFDRVLLSLFYAECLFFVWLSTAKGYRYVVCVCALYFIIRILQICYALCVMPCDFVSWYLIRIIVLYCFLKKA